MNLAQAHHRAELWRQDFAAQSLPGQAGPLCATLSAGVAGFPLHGSTFAQVAQAADHALYQAKTAGRNRVVVEPVVG